MTNLIYITYIDDNLILLDIACEVLEKTEGFIVTTAAIIRAICIHSVTSLYQV